jgi:uncharacterized hydrophobic protein (TIGR00271 family)
VLHLRVICPPELTEHVLALLKDARGATHLTLHRGAALVPAGDVVEADVARECTNSLLDALGDLGVEREGGVTLEAIDTTLSVAARRAQEAAPGEADDAVIWEELVARTGEESRLTWTFAAFLVLAVLIAAVGVVTDSPVTVVGAMAVGPEFGPLAAIAVNLVRRRPELVGRAAVAVGVGFPLAMVATLLGALLAEAAGLVTAQSLEGADKVDFIYQVGPFSFVVALLAGTAGMLSLVSSKSAALVGVFISVTTVPAAGYAVVAATLGRWDRAGESALQLLVNLVGITVAATAVLAVLHRHRARARDRSPAEVD